MLDIPSAEDGSSVYKGPYVTKDNDTAAFDKAVECTDDKTIVFHLGKPVGDFNYTVTSWSVMRTGARSPTTTGAHTRTASRSSSPSKPRSSTSD